MFFAKRNETLYLGICEAVGLRHFQPGGYTEPNDDGEYALKYLIDYTWIMTIRNVYWRDVSIGVVALRPDSDRSNVELRGFIIINLSDEETFIGSRPFRYFLVQPEEIQIMNYLRQIDLFAETRGAVLDDFEASASFSLEVLVKGGRHSVEYLPAYLPTDAVGKALWKEMRDLAEVFAQKSGDPAIIDFIEKGPKK